ncbi:MAG TPA: SDR family NAD(P)-dependent oxidoreductase [Vicinamibacterales bacterium]|nr:SDR family NAD(P)-dependent oxidoreductase [Vicinamibacterales bacterium]
MTARKVVVITGAGSGLGQLAARRALDHGQCVAALDVNRAGLSALGDCVSLLKLEVDVTDPQAVEAAVDRIERDLGPIDRMMHAAAIMPLGLVLEQRLDVIHKVMTINYGGLVNISRAVLPRMLSRGSGEFVSFASMAGLMPTIYMGAYCASKFAVVALTEVLHHENRGRGVKFACVCPPAVATPLLNQARDTVWPKMFDEAPPITPEEVLSAVERALESGELMVLPGRGTRLIWRLRRWVPDLVWKRVHAVEAR